MLFFKFRRQFKLQIRKKRVLTEAVIADRGPRGELKEKKNTVNQEVVLFTGKFSGTNVKSAQPFGDVHGSWSEPAVTDGEQ